MTILAIVGRPNVGKSTLFNRLVGKRGAIVHPASGVTRDWQEGFWSSSGGERFVVRDTPGLNEIKASDTLSGRMFEKTAQALEGADVALFMLDAKLGVTAQDQEVATFLRQNFTGCIIVLANKCEGPSYAPESWGLGFGEPILFSAAHGLGVDALLTRLGNLSPPDNASIKDPPETLDPLTIAVVGRPNVGKSTMVNAWLRSRRLLVGPEAGITRDSVTLPLLWKGRTLHISDTAGLRRKSHITKKLEHFSVAQTLGEIKFAHVVVLILEAGQALEKQDLLIAQHVVTNGRGLVVVVNKWDLVNTPKDYLAFLHDKLSVSLAQIKKVPVVTTSALKKKHLGAVLEAAVATYTMWTRRIPTSPLNRWLQAALEAHPPPLVGHRRLKLRYITQTKARPPTFVVFASGEIPLSYQRYLLNSLGQDFHLEGVPLRLHARKGKNPYAPDL